MHRALFATLAGILCLGGTGLGSAMAKPLTGDPVGRRLFLETAKPAAIAQSYGQLLSGDSTAFAIVASWVLSGHPLPPATAPDSPAAEFFRELFERTPSAERDAFLMLGLRGQLANPGILSRAPRIALTADAASQRRVTRYLAAFTAPTPTPKDAPKELLDAELRQFATYPDPRMVRIAGALALAAAVPHLERFIALKRRFFHLHTDYSTHPEPVDALFIESLRALVEIAEREPTAAESVQLALGRALEQARRESAADPMSIDGPGEPIVLETFDDNEGQALPTRGVRSARLNSGSGVRDKVAWLTMAQAALRGDRAQRASLSRAETARPRQPISDAIWTVESDSAQAALSGDRLYLVTRIFVGKQHRPVLWSLDAPTGKTRFISALGGYGDDGVELVTGKLLADAEGPILLATVRDAKGGQNGARIFRFDPETGEVRDAHPLVVQGREDAALLAADSDGYLLQRGQTLFHQRRSGTLGWRWDLPRDARVAVSEATALALLKREVRLRNRQGERALSAQVLLGTPDFDESAIPLALPDGFAIAEPGKKKLSRFDGEGRPRGQWSLVQGADHGSQLEGPWAGQALRGRDRLQVLAQSGPPIELVTPLNVSHVFLTQHAACVGSERALVEQPLDGTAGRPLPDLGHPHMARVVAADAERIFMLAYKDGYQLFALRRTK